MQGVEIGGEVEAQQLGTCEAPHFYEPAATPNSPLLRLSPYNSHFHKADNEVLLTH